MLIYKKDLLDPCRPQDQGRSKSDFILDGILSMLCFLNS